VARVLIAEDESSVRDLVGRALKQDGHEVVGTADGVAALDKLVEAEGQFDLEALVGAVIAKPFTVAEIRFAVTAALVAAKRR
jgi:hypothetical protein